MRIVVRKNRTNRILRMRIKESWRWKNGKLDNNIIASYVFLDIKFVYRNKLYERDARREGCTRWIGKKKKND